MAKFVSIRKFAEATGLHYAMVWRLVQAGDIRARRLHPRGFWMVEAGQIAEWKDKMA